MADSGKPTLKVREVDQHGHVLVDELANAISHEYDVNYRPAKRRLKLLGYHRTHGWDLD